MADEPLAPPSETPKPAPDAAKPQGEFHEVDTDVQEKAGKEREESGGYD